MDNGFTSIPDVIYPTAHSGWVHLSRQGTANCIIHIALYIYIYVCVCVCVCVYMYFRVYVYTGVYTS